jgi:hypothetical protein
MIARVRIVALLVALLCWCPSAVDASPTPPPSTPPTSTNADPCATAVPDLPNDLPSAFAYEITSAPVLHFLSQIKSVPEREQKHVFERVINAASSPAQRDLEVAEQRVCPTLEQIYARTRALIFVANEWTFGGLHDADKFSIFAAIVGDAITALSLGEELTPDQHRAALLPFQTLPHDVGPGERAGLGEGKPCAQPDAPAQTIHAVAPIYPAMAGASGTAGRANILISLNADGDVQAAKSFGNTFGDRPGADDLVNAAILAAAASTYLPAVHECKAIAGRYVFVVEFNRR